MASRDVVVAVLAGLALLLAIGSTASAAGEERALVLDAAGTYDVAPFARVYGASPDERLEDYDALRARGRFDAPAADAHARLHEGGHIWVIFEVQQRLPGNESGHEWVVWNPGAAQYLDARIRISDGTERTYANGFFVPPQQRPLQAIGYAFPLRLEGDQRAEIVLRGYVPPREDNVVKLLAADTFRSRNLVATLLVFGVMGAAFALGMYNAVLFLAIRERSYGFYALYALCAVLLWATTHSLVNLFIDDGRLCLTLNGLAAVLVALASILFTREFLELPRFAPRLDRLFLVLRLAMFGLASTVFVVPQPTWKLVAALIAIPTMLSVIAAPVYALYRGHRRARLMVIGWVPLMAFPLLIGLRRIGVIEGAWVTKNLMLIFHGFEILTMGLAIADRFRQLEAERTRAQDEAVAQLKLRLEEREQLARAEMETRAAHERAERERIRGATDALTGLRNRRAFDTEQHRVSTEWTRDSGVDILVCVIDIDGLKRLNDERGHAEGDRMLAAFGAALAKSLRDSDRVYRVGGDEFSVIARAPDAAAQAAIRRRIREAIDIVKGAFSDIDASVGAALLSETAGSVTDAYRLADERMYEEKHATRASGKRASPELTATSETAGRSAPTSPVPGRERP